MLESMMLGYEKQQADIAAYKIQINELTAQNQELQANQASPA